MPTGSIRKSHLFEQIMSSDATILMN